MKKIFAASLCYKGLVGGGITVDDFAITYRTNKLTVPKHLKEIHMLIKDIEKIENTRAALLVPAVEIHMKSGQSYKFIIFGRKNFEKNRC